MPELFLLYFFVIFLFDPLIGGEKIVVGQEGMANLVDDIHAGVINKWHELCFKLIKVVEDSLLQASTLWFCDRIYIEFSYQIQRLLFTDEDCWPHMVMIFFYARAAPARLFPNTALASAEGGYFLPVLAFRHFNLKIYILITIYSHQLIQFAALHSQSP